MENSKEALETIGCPPEGPPDLGGTKGFGVILVSILVREKVRCDTDKNHPEDE